MCDETKDTVPVLGELAPAVGALKALAEAFPTLRSSTIEVGTVVTRTRVAVGIEVRLHAPTTFADFESWRSALAADPADIEHRPLATVSTLTAFAEFHGVPVVVTAYGRSDRLAPAA